MGGGVCLFCLFRFLDFGGGVFLCLLGGWLVGFCTVLFFCLFFQEGKYFFTHSKNPNLLWEERVIQ